MESFFTLFPLEKSILHNLCYKGLEAQINNKLICLLELELEGNIKQLLLLLGQDWLKLK